jgi:hypothetical protein
MSSAKALLIGLYSYVRLHHRCAENKLKLVILKLVIERAEWATAGFVGGRFLKRLVYGYCVDIFHNSLRINDLQKKLIYVKI